MVCNNEYCVCPIYEHEPSLHHEYESPLHHEYEHSLHHEYEPPLHHEYEHPLHHEYEHPLHHEYEPPLHHEYEPPLHHEYDTFGEVHCDPNSVIPQQCPNGEYCSRRYMVCNNEYCICPIYEHEPPLHHEYELPLHHEYEPPLHHEYEPPLHHEYEPPLHHSMRHSNVPEHKHLRFTHDSEHSTRRNVPEHNHLLLDNYREVHCDPNSVIPQQCPNGQYCSRLYMQCNTEYCICPIHDYLESEHHPFHQHHPEDEYHEDEYHEDEHHHPHEDEHHHHIHEDEHHHHLHEDEHHHHHPEDGHVRCDPYSPILQQCPKGHYCLPQYLECTEKYCIC